MELRINNNLVNKNPFIRTCIGFITLLKRCKKEYFIHPKREYVMFHFKLLLLQKREKCSGKDPFRDKL